MTPDLEAALLRAICCAGECQYLGQARTCWARENAVYELAMVLSTIHYTELLAVKEAAQDVIKQQIYLPVLVGALAALAAAEAKND